MKLLQLIRSVDNQSIFIKAENLIAFSPYDEGAAIELTSGSVFMVKESPKTIMVLLNTASGGDLALLGGGPTKLTVIDSSDITI